MAKQTTTGKKTTRAKKRNVGNVPVGVVHVYASFNNTIITITDQLGRVLAWASAGKVKYSGSRKSSAFAATVAAQKAVEEVKPYGMKEASVILKGPGAGRESAVRGIQAGLNVTSIQDRTPVPHNGCRPRKRRRV